MARTPIALFAFNRPEHLAQTIYCLQRNSGADEHPLVVFCDGPRKSVRSDTDQVDEVRQICRAIDGFASVTVIERDRNLGLSQSLIGGVSEVLDEFGQIIVVEDDLVTSPCFLDFMERGLEQFHNEQKVACVHGYMYPTTDQLPETFFIRGADCWGWATWKRAWDLLEQDGTVLVDRLLAQGDVDRFNYFGAYDYLGMLRAQVRGEIDSWAIRWHASCFLEKKLCLYPCRSLVVNTGFDASGTHCTDEAGYSVELAREPVTISGPVEECEQAVKAIETFFRTIHQQGSDRKAGIAKRLWRKLFFGQKPGQGR